MTEWPYLPTGTLFPPPIGHTRIFTFLIGWGPAKGRFNSQSHWLRNSPATLFSLQGSDWPTGRWQTMMYTMDHIVLPLVPWNYWKRPCLLIDHFELWLPVSAEVMYSVSAMASVEMVLGLWQRMCMTLKRNKIWTCPLDWYYLVLHTCWVLQVLICWITGTWCYVEQVLGSDHTEHGLPAAGNRGGLRSGDARQSAVGNRGGLWSREERCGVKKSHLVRATK